jgi:hypothetical protein
MVDGRVPEPVRPYPDLTVRDTGPAGGGDRLAAASVERSASTRIAEGETDGGRSIDLRPALSAVSVYVEHHHHNPTGHGHPMASNRLPTVLALEVALSRRAATGSNGDPAANPGNELGQPPMRCAAHSWRTPNRLLKKF